VLKFELWQQLFNRKISSSRTTPIMALLAEKQPLGIASSSAFHIQVHFKKMLRPTEAIQYGMSTLFRSLLSELLKYDISIAVHATPSFTDKNPLPIPGVASNRDGL
jgi:hypothetical protein